MKTKNRSYRGGAFSLVETMIVVAVIAIWAALAVPAARAGVQQQTDSSTNQITGTGAGGWESNNVYALYGDITGNYTNGFPLVAPNQFVDTSKTTTASFECGGYFTNNTAAATNVLFAIYQSNDLKLWTVSTNILVSVPALSTNWCFTQFNLYIQGSGFQTDYALRSVAITNGTGIGTTTNASSTYPNGIFFRAFTRSGI